MSAAPAHEEALRRFEIEARPLIEKLAEVRSAQTYCRESELAKRALWRPEGPVHADIGTPALDRLEQDLLRRLGNLRTSFNITVH